MTTLLAALFVLVSPPEGEIRVYLADKDKNPVDLKGITALVLIEPEGGKRKMLKTDVVTPKGGAKRGIGHGGEVSEMDGYHVEFRVVKKGAAPKETDGTPYFSASVDLGTWKKFSAVVVFRMKGDTRNAKGFQYPPLVPGTYRDAVAKLEKQHKAAADALKAENHKAFHRSEKTVAKICAALPGLAPEAARAEVGKVAKEIKKIFQQIDHADHSGDAAGVKKALDAFKARVGALKKHAAAGGP